MNLILNVLEVVLPLIFSVAIENSLDILTEATLLLIELAYDVIVNPLLLIVFSLSLLHFVSEGSQVDNFRGQLSLSILNLSFDLSHGFSNLLQSLVLSIVKQFLLI